MNTLIHIVGNRPQFIKLAFLHAELKKSGGILQKIVHTGQHNSLSMSDAFFNEFNIPTPDCSLDISTSPADMFIASASIEIQKYLQSQKEASVFVYGDTNTTLAAAIASKRVGVKLFHFEAGIRTNDLTMPEELNRVLTDRLADVNFCCTNHNYETMRNEGFGKAINSACFLSGDLLYDIFLKFHNSDTSHTVKKEYIACTIHRAGNIGNKQSLDQIITALNYINMQIPVIVPLHPHTEKKIREYKLQPKFTIIAPLGYAEMKTFIKQATYVFTDSGGVIREAYFAKKKSINIMSKPFWPEIAMDNCSLSAEPEYSFIIQEFNKLPSLKANFNNKIFGNGTACEKIIDVILKQVTE